MLKTVTKFVGLGLLVGGMAFGVMSGAGCDDSSGNCGPSAASGGKGGGASGGAAGGQAGGAAGGQAGGAAGSAGGAGGA